MDKIFTAGGYDFFRDSDGYWQCVKEGSAAPTRGAYGRADSLARLKDVPLHRVPACAARLDVGRVATSRALQDIR